MTGCRQVLTPSGAGVLSLFIPGLIIAGVSGQQLFGMISIGAGLVLVANSVMARRHVSQLTLTATGPVMATVGQPFVVCLALEGRSNLECALNIAHAERAWVPVEAPARGDLVMRVDDRGVLDRLRIRLQTSAPFGLTACIRTVEVELNPPVSIAPQSLPATVPSSLASPDQLQHHETDEVSGLRPFNAGDRQRDVNWPAFARTGSLLVRNHHGEHARSEVDVVVDTSGLEPMATGDGLAGVEGGDADGDVEALLGRARNAMEQILAAGYRIRLATVEAGPPDQVVTAYVNNPIEVAVRLARVAADPSTLVPTIGGTTPPLVATPKGLAWRPIR